MGLVFLVGGIGSKGFGVMEMDRLRRSRGALFLLPENWDGWGLVG